MVIQRVRSADAERRRRGHQWSHEQWVAEQGAVCEAASRLQHRRGLGRGLQYRSIVISLGYATPAALAAGLTWRGVTTLRSSLLHQRAQQQGFSVPGPDGRKLESRQVRFIPFQNPKSR